MIEKVKRDPLSPKMLKVNGEDVMRELGLPPGPRIGWISTRFSKKCSMIRRGTSGTS